MKKGFTLVELLSIMVVIGIIAVLVVPQIGKSVNSVKEEQYERLINMIETSGKAYHRVNRDVLKIPVEELKKGKYITTNMVNPITNEEIKGCVRVSVNNEGINEYKYYESNDCENRNIVLTVELNGGSSSQTFSSSYEEGTKIKLESPTKAESSFDKWMVTKGDSVLNKDTLIVGSIDTTIYALYTNQPKFTLDLDGGSVSKTYLTQYDSGSNIELESPRKKGTNFVRWEIVEGNGVLSGNTYTQGSIDTVLKAIYESCPIGAYNDGNSSSCKACQDGLTTSEEGKSSCDVSCDNNSNVSSWNISTYDSSTNTVSGVCSINTCEPCYKKESNRCNAQTTLYVSSSGNDSNGGYETSIPFKTINKAYTCPGNLTIKLLSNIVQDNEAKFNTLNKEVFLTSNTGTYTITRGNGLTSGSIIELSNKGKLTTTNVVFDGNNVTATEPVIDVSGGSTIDLNSGTTVQNGINTLEWQPGGILVHNSTININGATITANKSNASNKGNGGGIKVWKGTINLNSGTISNNSSSLYGGGIYVQADGARANINGGTITGNTASVAGGGITIQEYESTDSVILTMTSGTISNNSAEIDGGGIYIQAATSNISGGTISGNSAKKGGGLSVMSDTADGILNLSGGTIKSNTSTEGGGIWVGPARSGYDTKTVLNMTGGTISYNNATEGAGVYSKDSTMTMYDGLINNNISSGGAGGIASYQFGDKNSTLNIIGGSISNNSARNGGGIRVVCASGKATKNDFAMSGGIIENNTSSSTSGGIELFNANCTQNQYANISGTTIIRNNSSTERGGGITIDNYVTTISENVSIQNNKSGLGGGIDILTNGKLNFANGTIFGNSCTSGASCGGGIRKGSDCTYNKTGGTISSNTPQDYIEW